MWDFSVIDCLGNQEWEVGTDAIARFCNRVGEETFVCPWLWVFTAIA
ncbi:MAG: hypothetical protein RMY28_032410 [Nostoc sp. ChiSLP01]|nr:hypothetical protein [Nostoc sp. CmiSLP01]MDZ8284261.1 hypothetical protein [Nostoc sp. ChiSLP01]